jgi:hypothetical protein
MPRKGNHTTPRVVSRYLYTDDVLTTGTRVGSPAWFAWLDTASTFYYEGYPGTFTARREPRQRGGLYWMAYSRHQGLLRRVYLGKSHQLTPERLQAVAASFALPILKERGMPMP